MGFLCAHTKASVKKRASHPEDHSSKHKGMNLVLYEKFSYPEKDQASSYKLVSTDVFYVLATLLLSSSDFHSRGLGSISNKSVWYLS